MLPRRGTRSALALATLLLGLLTAAPANAATVKTAVTTSPSTFNQTTISFAAAPGEANHLTLSLASTELAETLDVRLVDSGAPISPGAGCTGGGPAGTPVDCLVRSRGAESRGCGRDCEETVPGTQWKVTADVELGDEENSLDATELEEGFSEPIDLQIVGGPQADVIETGSGRNSIFPGGGDDEVIGGHAFDTIHAGAGPDGNDIYDLGPKFILGYRGPGEWGRVDYSLRTEPLNFQEGVGGGAGEDDQIVNATIVGGYGDDTFVAPAHEPGAFEGGPGDDLIVGQEQNDTLYGNGGGDRIYGNGGRDVIVGGAGDDLLEGGSGDDAILEDGGSIEYPSPNSLEQGDGDDIGHGGAGNDRIYLGTGDDTAYGEEGDDELRGGSGNDHLFGGAGSDFLMDDEGSPGEGDGFSCGEGQDKAYIDAFDTVEDCESVHLPNVFSGPKLGRDLTRGTAILTFRVPSAGRVIATGAGINGAMVRAKTVGSGYVARVPLDPHGKARKELRRRGRCHVSVDLTFVRAAGGIFEHRWVFGLDWRRAS